MSIDTGFLAGIPLFAGLSPLELGAVAELLAVRSVLRGARIFSEGERGNEMFIVRDGLVDSFMTGSDGVRRGITEFGPGSIFGEMAIVEGEPRSASCFARTDAELYVLDGLEFFRIVWDYPVLGTKLLSRMIPILVSRLNRTSSFLDDMFRWGITARRRAVTDDLSGLYNRHFIEESVRLRCVARAGDNGVHSLLFLDLDRFREINAAFGSTAGDSVIASAAAAIQRCLRETDIAARLSGDEFAVLLPDTPRGDAGAVAESIRLATAGLSVECRGAGGPVRVRVTVSIGTATFPEDGRTQSELFAAADRALFRAKGAGRNRVLPAGREERRRSRGHGGSRED